MERTEVCVEATEPFRDLRARHPRYEFPSLVIVRIEMGHSYAEVAEALGKPSVAAAHMAVSRALVRLAREMSRGRA